MYIMYKLHIIFILVVCITEAKKPDRNAMLKAIKQMIYDLERYIEYAKREKDVLDNHLQDLKEGYDEASKDIPNYFSNEVTHFMAIKRLTADLEFIEMISNSTLNYQRDVSQHYPTDKDLDEAVEGLTGNLINLANTKTVDLSSTMTSSDCYVVGDFIRSGSGNYRKAVEWFLQASMKYNMTTPEAYPFKYLDLIARITYCYDSIDDNKETLDWLIKLMNIDEYSANSENTALVKKLRKQIMDNPRKFAARSRDMAVNYNLIND